MKFTFNITKNNIKNGKQADPANCAIARAVENNIKNKGLKFKRVSVLPNDITIKYFNEKTKRNSESVEIHGKILSILTDILQVTCRLMSRSPDFAS